MTNTTRTTVAVQIGERKETFVLFQTNAPQAYDHGAAIELYDGTIDGKVERYVLIPEEAVEWQRGRNGSGMKSFVTEDVILDERDLAGYLWKRLYGATS
jgi:hypothetical protein